MCVYIGIEDLAANALITLLNNEGKRCVSYNELESYGATVVGMLEKKGQRVILILSRNSTDAMLRNYSNFFKEEPIGDEMGIALMESVSVDDLEKAFRGYLSLDVLIAFIKASSTEKKLRIGR